MAIFACIKCGFTHEKLVSTAYRRHILHRIDYCNKCDKPRRFYFLTASGMVGRYKHLPPGMPTPNRATMWWRKTRDGKKASAPLDAVCCKSGY